jgi:ribonuclease P protein component
MRAARLRRSGDIATVRAEGRSLRRGAFNVRVRQSGGPSTRVAVTASRTVGTAVVRNRARRRVREAFRLALASQTKPTAIDVVVTVHPAAKDRDFRAIASEARSVLQEAAR